MTPSILWLIGVSGVILALIGAFVTLVAGADPEGRGSNYILIGLLLFLGGAGSTVFAVGSAIWRGLH